MQEHSRKGAFDTLRLIAALMVFHSHSFALAGYVEPHVPGQSWAGMPVTLGTVAVMIFFTLSGYWVTRSALGRSLVGYATSRALRIVPGLFVCCLITIGVCALATSEIVNDYFREGDTWRWLHNALPLFLPQRTHLPGVFEDGPYSDPNGSLWTLPYEVLCYLLAGAAAVFGPRGMRFVMVSAAIYAAIVVLGGAPDAPVQLTSALDSRELALLVGLFFFGALLNEISDHDLGRLLLVLALGELLCLKDNDLAVPIGGLFYGGAAVWAGRRLDLDRVVTRGQDLSYGIYIYAFPCEQLAARALPPHDHASYLLYYVVGLASTLALALASWALVEKPALTLKERFAGAFERGVGRLPLARMLMRSESQP